MAIINTRCNAIEELDHDPKLLDSVVGRHFSGIDPQTNVTRKDLPPQNVDIAIIGGGIIGSGLACQMWHSSYLRDRMIILDSQAYLVKSFFEMITANSQRVMRSPYEHQIAPDGDVQMLDFARLFFDRLSSVEREQIIIALSGQRSVVPSDIFIAHTAYMISIHQLRKIAYQFSVAALYRDNDGMWIIKNSIGYSIRAKAVIMVTGSKPAPLSPPLARACRLYGDHVQPAYGTTRHIQPKERVMVVGSGLTAGHIILQILATKAHPIWSIRHEERYRCADFDTAYFRTEGIARFRKLAPMEKATLLAEEYRGSLMLEFLPLLKEANLVGFTHVVTTKYSRLLRLLQDSYLLTFHQDKQNLLTK